MSALNGRPSKLLDNETSLSEVPNSHESKISVSQVTRDFPTRRGVVHALGPVDLEISSGEFVCLVGPSGCGKSTLLRMMANLIRPSEGRVTINRSRSDRPVTAMVFQEYSIYPWKTVADNIALGLKFAGRSRSEIHDSVQHWMHRVGLEAFADAYPGTLSGGMRQRVSIARALAVEPEILLMDEPFAALDAQLRTVLQEELLALWQSDERTVVFVTHSLEEAIFLGDRIVVLSARPGRVLADVRVPFVRPRGVNLRGQAEFAALHERLWELLRGEVSRGVSQPQPE